jgi:formate dehydrogenase major subunit
MEKSMLTHAGFLTGFNKRALNGMIDVVKKLETETGYPAILQLSEAESAMRTMRVRRTKTVCTYCGVGCSFDVWTKDRHILKVAPLNGPANGVSTCVKGKFGWDFVNSQDRLTTPLVREGDHFREAEWDEALDLVARRFKETKAAHGPDALSFIASSKCTNEEAFLMQKLARAVIGTNNVDNCSRYCQSPATMGLLRTVTAPMDRRIPAGSGIVRQQREAACPSSIFASDARFCRAEPKLPLIIFPCHCPPSPAWRHVRRQPSRGLPF